MTINALLQIRARRSPVAGALGLLLVAGLAGACGSKPAASAAVSTPTVTADTWAVVDGRTITRDAVEKAYKRSQQDPTQTVSDDEAMSGKLGVLDDLILQDLLIAKADQLKITVADGDLDKAYADAKKNITDEAFQQETAKRGLTAADIRDGLKRQLLSQKEIGRAHV